MGGLRQLALLLNRPLPCIAGGGVSSPESGERWRTSCAARVSAAGGARGRGLVAGGRRAVAHLLREGRGLVAGGRRPASGTDRDELLAWPRGKEKDGDLPVELSGVAAAPERVAGTLVLQRADAAPEQVARTLGPIPGGAARLGAVSSPGRGATSFGGGRRGELGRGEEGAAAAPPLLMDRRLPARRTTLARQIWPRSRRTTLARQIWPRQTAAGGETHLNQKLADSQRTHRRRIISGGRGGFLGLEILFQGRSKLEKTKLF
ncbi:hypothetical protein BDA96_06G058900 [Sorghum bicolor]|uniref:DUF834 domain-containing protein n=2 Tax=Sorghum bicolor TaxID=4558 RepID=A0A921QRA1_SORBI|nr:hypothetical protein BDA96_06G058900 [Sorghum bicolor]OQU81401.1 hypothetical protein SORBI_3006G052250 [Sorghum bicolor]